MELGNKYVLVYHLPCIICVMGFNPTPACTDVWILVTAGYQHRDISFSVCHQVIWESIRILQPIHISLPVAEINRYFVISNYIWSIWSIPEETVMWDTGHDFVFVPTYLFNILQAKCKHCPFRCEITRIKQGYAVLWIVSCLGTFLVLCPTNSPQFHQHFDFFFYLALEIAIDALALEGKAKLLWMHWHWQSDRGFGRMKPTWMNVASHGLGLLSSSLNFFIMIPPTPPSVPYFPVYHSLGWCLLPSLRLWGF